jgi:hypothetical protein
MIAPTASVPLSLFFFKAFSLFPRFSATYSIRANSCNSWTK